MQILHPSPLIFLRWTNGENHFFLTYRKNKTSSFAFMRVQNLLNADYNLSQIGKSWLHSFLVQISCSALHCFVSLIKCAYWQCRSKGNITGGARERRRREPLGGSGGMLPQKILKARGLEMLFPAFSKSDMWFMHIANYLLRTLSQQTNVHWEYNTCNVNY